MESLDIYKFKKLIKQEIIENYLYRNNKGMWNSIQYTSNIYPAFTYTIINYSPLMKLATYNVKCSDTNMFDIESKKDGIYRFHHLIQSSPHKFHNMIIGTYIRIIVDIVGYRINYPIIYNKCIVPSMRFNYDSIQTNGCLVENYE